jgi:hypothetical protein
MASCRASLASIFFLVFLAAPATATTLSFSSFTKDDALDFGLVDNEGAPAPFIGVTTLGPTVAMVPGAFASSSVDGGVLHAFATADAAAQGEGLAQAAYSEDFAFSSPTLPNGTLVPVAFSIVLTGTASGSGCNAISANLDVRDGPNAVGGLDLLNSTCQGPFGPQNNVFAVALGHVITARWFLEAVATGGVADASNSLHFFVAAPGDVSYITGSGLTYSSPSDSPTPTPEPASILLSGTGAALLIANLRRRKAQSARV